MSDGGLFSFHLNKTKTMATIKGQNLRVMVGEDSDRLLCIGASRDCQVHLALQVQEDTTKDTDDDWIVNEPVGINWDAQVDALVTDIDYVSAVGCADLIVGMEYTLRFTQTAGAAGGQNRDSIDTPIQFTGKAILSDLQVNAQNQDDSSYTARFTGSGPIVMYVPVVDSFKVDNGDVQQIVDGVAAFSRSSSNVTLTFYHISGRQPESVVSDSTSQLSGITIGNGFTTVVIGSSFTDTTFHLTFTQADGNKQVVTVITNAS